MADLTILSCAVTGNQSTLAQSPHIPVTPEQIALSSLEAIRAGAAIVHIHVRHLDGRPSMDLAHYREVVERLRAADEDVIINLTTGPGGRFIPGEEDPAIAAPGTLFLAPEKRIAHVLALRPEICTLDFNTMYFGTAVVINTPRNLRIMAEQVQAAGVKPELEVFDSGDIQLANAFLKDGLIAPRALFQIVLGVKYGAIATPASMQYMQSLLPKDADWAAFGIGREAFPMVAQSWLLGGHCRVGLEDTLRLSKQELATSNAVLVDRAVRIIRELGGRVATPGEAREMLQLKRQAPRPDGR